MKTKNSSKTASIKDIEMNIINGGPRLARYPEEIKFLTPEGKAMEPDGKDVEPDGKVMELKDDLPDGGWAWIVVFGSFMCNVVLDGIAFSYGILLIPLLESFDSSRSIISNGGSFMFGFYLLSSPISGMMINKFGSRIVCAIGCIIGALGIGLSSFSPNVTTLMITYGVIGGYGLGTMYLPSMVVISDYFDKKRGLATGIADSGSGVGILVFAPLTAILVQNYGWEGTHLAFGGFCLVSILFAAIMGPLDFKHKKIEKDEKTGENGAVQDDHKSETELFEPKKSNLNGLVDAMNLSILINPMFLIVGIANLIACLGLFVPYFYLPDLVVERNFTREKSSYLISAMGISNTFGRIGTCWISDIPMINSLWSCVMALLITGVTLIAVPFCKSYVEFMIASILFGFFSAALQMNPVIMVDLLGVENLSLALGYVMIFRGIGVFSGPPTAGLVYDGTNSYDIPFYLAGGFIVLSSLVLTFAAVFQKPRRKMENSNGVKKIGGE